MDELSPLSLYRSNQCTRNVLDMCENPLKSGTITLKCDVVGWVQIIKYKRSKPCITIALN